MAIIIKNGYQDNKGIMYEDIMNVNFERKEDMNGNLVSLLLKQSIKIIYFCLLLGI